MDTGSQQTQAATEQPARSNPKLEALATDLFGSAHDPRVRSRARVVLDYLAATSPSEAERQRWQRMLGSLPEP